MNTTLACLMKRYRFLSIVVSGAGWERSVPAVLCAVRTIVNGGVQVYTSCEQTVLNKQEVAERCVMECVALHIDCRKTLLCKQKRVPAQCTDRAAYRCNVLTVLPRLFYSRPCDVFFACIEILCIIRPGIYSEQWLHDQSRRVSNCFRPQCERMSDSSKPVLV
jgi:hypothetical protein